MSDTYCVDVRYDNSDLACSRDAEITAVIEKNHGEVNGNGQDLETRQRDLHGVTVTHPMTHTPDVTPIFTTVPDVPPRDVLPALARLLIDLDRRSRQGGQELPNDGALIMLKELSLDPVAPRLTSPCPPQN